MTIGTSKMLRRGLRRRCAVCGADHLFRHWVQMAEVCPGCGLHFQRIPGHWLGSWFLNVLVAQLTVVAVLIIGVATTFPDTPIVPIATIGVALAIVVPFAFFPISRTLWTAIDLAMRPLTFDEGVAPGFELEGDVDPDPDPDPDDQP